MMIMIVMRMMVSADSDHEKVKKNLYLDSSFQVFCDNDFITAVFARKDLPKHVNIARLYFRHRSCRARWNSKHVIAKAPLTGCGTVFSKTEQTLFFTNILSEEGRDQRVGVITRDNLFRANLTCAYPRKRTVGSFRFAPAKQRLFVNLGEYVTLIIFVVNRASTFLLLPFK